MNLEDKVIILGVVIFLALLIPLPEDVEAWSYGRPFTVDVSCAYGGRCDSGINGLAGGRTP